MVTATARDYRDLLIRLLPKGPWWGVMRERIADRLFLALGEEFARVHNRLVTLIHTDMHPGRAQETLAAWLDMLDLPRRGESLPAAEDDQRALSWAQYTATGGSTEDYFVELAANLGITIQIEEYHARVFRCGRSHAGDPLYGPSYKFAFEVLAPAATSDDMRTALENLINEQKPAHTVVKYTYSL